MKLFSRKIYKKDIYYNSHIIVNNFSRAKQPQPSKNLPPINKKTTRHFNQNDLIYFQNI